MTTSQVLNAKLVDLDRFSGENDAKFMEAKSSNSLKKNAALQAVNAMMPDELEKTVKAARTRAQDNERLKLMLRHNAWSAMHPIRKDLWRFLLQSSTGDKENRNENSNEEYSKHLNQIFGKSRDIDLSLPEFVFCSNPNSTTLSIDSMGSTSSSSNSVNHLNYYNLSHEGRQAVKRILCVFEYQYPQVTYSPGIVSITSLLAHYMQEHEVYQALCYMSSTKEHLIESKAAWDITSHVFVRLLKSYCKSSYDILAKYATDPVEVVLSDWYWWIFDCLPFEYLVKIVDCFIFEGQKVLYRISMSIVQSFTKFVKNQNLKVTKNSIKLFCESPASLESIDKLLKTSFNIRNLKRTTIKEFYVKEETKRKTLDSSPMSVAGSPNQTLALNHMNASPFSQKDADMFHNSPKRIFIQETSTGVMSHAHLTTLWNWVPQRLTVYAPSLLFTTEVDGTSMNTLFNVLDELEHCIIVIKTFENEIFGAFCSGSWNDRKQKGVLYFGSGETFLFTLQPEKKIFRWVGARNQTVTSNQELFMRADLTKFVIGSGTNEGLSISSNLSDGSTARCDTFENDPLCSRQHFQIAVLEVIGFGSPRS